MAVCGNNYLHLVCNCYLCSHPQITTFDGYIRKLVQHPKEPPAASLRWECSKWLGNCKETGRGAVQRPLKIKEWATRMQLVQRVLLGVPSQSAFLDWKGLKFVMVPENASLSYYFSIIAVHMYHISYGFNCSSNFFDWNAIFYLCVQQRKLHAQGSLQPFHELHHDIWAERFQSFFFDQLRDDSSTFGVSLWQSNPQVKGIGEVMSEKPKK